MVTIFAISAGAQNSSTDTSEDLATQQSSGQSVDQGQLSPPMNIDTSLPLQVVMSPLHWGRFSLLSVTAYQGFDSNPELQKTPQSTEFSAFNLLLVYSVRRSAWELDLQYQPSAFISPGVISKNLTGNAADFSAARRVSRLWNLSLGDDFNYLPNLQSSIQGNGLSVNLGGGISILTPFLSSSRSLLRNTANVSLNGKTGPETNMEFRANESFLRLSSVLNAPLISQQPAALENTISAGFTVTHTLGLKDTISGAYDFRAQSTPSGTLGTTTYHTASAGWSHVLRQNVRFSINGGPGWSTTTGSLTAQGSCQLAYETHSGGVGISFARSDEFIGVVSNSFNNRYLLRLDRRFGSRVSLTTYASYLQQQYSHASTLTGESVSLLTSYSVSRNWSVFGELRYLASNGNELSFPAQKIATFGVRWSWVPEKP